MTQSSDVHSPPDGFVPVQVGGAFATYNGPLHARWHDGRLQLGFRVGPWHVNPRHNCHGGMLGMFADILISTAAQYQADIPCQFLPTITLQMDCMASAPPGCWVQGQAGILRVTRNLLFVPRLEFFNLKATEQSLNGLIGQFAAFYAR